MFSYPFPIICSHTLLGEDEHLTIDGQVFLVIRSSGINKRSIIEAIYDLRTLVKVLEHRAIGLEIIVE
jgi:hypothetical protein